MPRAWYLVSFVDLRHGKFHQLRLNSLALNELKHMNHIQLLDSQYITKGSLT